MQEFYRVGTHPKPIDFINRDAGILYYLGLRIMFNYVFQMRYTTRITNDLEDSRDATTDMILFVFEKWE